MKKFFSSFLAAWRKLTPSERVVIVVGLPLALPVLAMFVLVGVVANAAEWFVNEVLHY